MEKEPCIVCKQPFDRYRNRKNQKICRKPECRRKRKNFFRMEQYRQNRENYKEGEVWVLDTEKEEWDKEVRLDIKILRLCLAYTRCRDCKRVKPRGTSKEFGMSTNFCPYCKSTKMSKRDKFFEWYEREGQRLDKLLPNPMPVLKEIKEMIKNA